MVQAFVFLNLFLIATLFTLSGRVSYLFYSKPEKLVVHQLDLADKLNQAPLFPQFSNEKALELNSSAYSLSLPDLRDQIQFLGRSFRPDETEKVLFFKMSGSNDIMAIKEKEPIYVTYTPSNPTKYQFSSHKKTALVLEITLPNDQFADVSVSLKDESIGPQKLSLPIKTNANEPWILNDVKVDQTLLIRERAKYCGKDLFLEYHGGEEFAFENERVRIDFEQQEPYALFVKENDLLLLEDHRWINNGIAKQETKNRPLMQVKSIDEHFIYFDLFNPLGDQKVPLKLIKSRTQNNCCPQIVTSQIRFIQAKTWAQFVVELQGERKTLKKGDWLIFTDHKWQLIDTPELIDQYVGLELVAPLFVIDELQKLKGQKIITGHLFSPARTEVMPIELMQQTDLKSLPPKIKTQFEEQS